jgi:hypothetical protein
MALRVVWEFKLVETRSIWNERPMEHDYAPTKSLKWSKPGQYGTNGPFNVITHAVLSLQIAPNEVSIE